MQVNKEGDIYATGTNSEGSFTWNGKKASDESFEIE